MHFLVALVFSNTSRFILLIDFSSVPTNTDRNSLLNCIQRLKNKWTVTIKFGLTAQKHRLSMPVGNEEKLQRRRLSQTLFGFHTLFLYFWPLDCIKQTETTYLITKMCGKLKMCLLIPKSQISNTSSTIPESLEYSTSLSLKLTPRCVINKKWFLRPIFHSTHKEND